MQTQSLLQAYEMTLFATQYLERLSRAVVLFDNTAVSEERSWLTTAQTRISNSLLTTQDKLKQARGLPELSVLREEAAVFHLGRWVDALEHLLSELTRELSANAPIIEILFPHQKFTSIRRGGKSADSFAADFETRVTSTYVTRIAADEEYKFLPPLLQAVREEHTKWRESTNPTTIDPDQEESLRAEGFAAAARLELALKQARLLAEAALADSSGAFEEFGLHSQPKRRSQRSEARKSAAPEKDATKDAAAE